DKGLFHYFVHNLTDWTVRNTRRVDDHPYGGGAGTIITIEPLVNALREIQEKYGKMDIIYFSPRGNLHTQESAEKYGKVDGQYCIICGHYEGIDERIFELFDITEISIGEYVLSSGELASLVWIDSVVRLIPGVISEDSLMEESFSVELGGKKEYPHYSRPAEFEGLKVPEVLLSGDQKKIREWNHGHTKN
ncbi:MAG: tRNA (guanosine(37)-N1)-methyltransferase TrmD, partial [Candidatus Gracilibacteria bacterium]|nr:tRNA (guanosine(37)-N1)-methyltransferase TrmD [Candidatus Gracilibacteria bacterium]